MATSSADLISQLQREADFQSSGRFSLEAKKALQKMQAFRLTDPCEFVLQLVSCAVMRGATRIQFEVGARDTRVAFDGEPFSDEELEKVFECALQDSQEPVTASGAHLAIALQAMKTFDPDVLIVESGQGKSKNVLQLYEDEVWIEKMSGTPQRNLVTYVGLESSLTLKNFCFPTLARAQRGEPSILKERAYASPIPVYLDGLPVGLPHCLNSFLLRGPGKEPAWAAGNHAGELLDLPFWGRWNQEVRRSRPGRIIFIQAGTAFPEWCEELPRDSALYILEDSLKRDLSQQSLVEDEIKKSRRSQALEAVWTLRRQT